MLSRRWSKYQGWWKTPFKQLPSVSWSHQALLYGIKKGLCLTEGVCILYLYRDSACVGFLWSIYFSRNELVKWSYIFSLCVPLQLWRERKLFVQILSWKLAKRIHLNMLRCAYWSKPDMFLIMKGFYRPCCSKSLHFRSRQAWATPATRVSKEVIVTSS